MLLHWYNCFEIDSVNNFAKSKTCCLAAGNQLAMISISFYIVPNFRSAYSQISNHSLHFPRIFQFINYEEKNPLSSHGKIFL